MDSVPRNVTEPFMSFDILGVVIIYAATGMVLATAGARGMIFRSIPLRAKPMVFFLYYVSNKILASPANRWLRGKCESSLMVLWIN